MVALTPYGQSVCINELKQRKRDRFTQRGSDLHKESQVLPSILTVVPTSPSSVASAMAPLPAAQLDLNNSKEVENELEKRVVECRE